MLSFDLVLVFFLLTLNTESLKQAKVIEQNNLQITSNLELDSKVVFKYWTLQVYNPLWVNSKWGIVTLFDVVFCQNLFLKYQR